MYLVNAETIDVVTDARRAEAIGQFDLFGGEPGTGGGLNLFDVRAPEQWDTKHQLALERELLGLYVSGHPLHGVEHTLARQVDTPIASILDGTVNDGAQVIVGGIVLVKARVSKRDDRISLIANDLVVPDLAQPGGSAGGGRKH